ncbi:hypothetical protein BG006_006193 [Podila minutissima]|uniref:Uncharacterized protein n=1 Tax=Podila minutissima TaxID=64525 RepID=A0A9P5VL83_9FUNG|nr:hypothetical protein BG006_006193 [Podila minutissima]
MTPAFQSQIRDELRIRKLALSYFGHQGIQDLAVLGAILGNNIREIGRYKVTCNGSLVQGQYTIYELVHFGILFATGRTKTRCTRRRRHLVRENIKQQQQQHTSQTGSGSDKQEGETTATVTRIYPTMLANLFPAVVFKALRTKSRQLPRLSEENSDDEEQEESSSSSSLPLRRFRRRSSSGCSASGSGDYSTFASSSMFLRRDSTDSTASGHSITHTNNTSTDIHQDPFLVSAGSVVTLLIKNRLHRVRDLPMPRELCFMGAVSLPLPPALRAMHVAWTMDFLATKAITQRRARSQQQQGVRDQGYDVMDSANTAPLGGLEFRQEVYAHKMAIARTVRAQQLKHRQQQDQKSAAPSQSSSSSSSSSPAQPQPQQNRLSLSMGQPRHSFLIPAQINEEQEEEEDFDGSVSEAARVSSEIQSSSPPSPTLSFYPSAHNATKTPCAAAATATATTASNTANTGNTTTATSNHTRSIRQSKRLMQQILSLENKVPRSVRKWAVVARTCFSHELVAEDRLVQEWVDKQRIEVVLACGGYPRQQQLQQQRLSFGEAATQGDGVSGMLAPSQQQASERDGVTQGRSNASTPTNNTSTTPSTSTTTSSSATITSPSFLGSSLGRMGFAEGIRLGNNNNSQYGYGEMVSRPTSGVHAGADNRMSASQQMLSMHLWLSVLVSPLSPQQMVYDQFME